MEIFELKDLINPIELQNYDDFWFEFEFKEDGTFKRCLFKWKKLKSDLWEAVYQMRGELIKAHRKERDQYKKKIKACEVREFYKDEMIKMMEKNKRQRKDNHYQERTCALYRKILEKLVNLPWDDNPKEC